MTSTPSSDKQDPTPDSQKLATADVSQEEQGSAPQSSAPAGDDSTLAAAAEPATPAEERSAATPEAPVEEAPTTAQSATAEQSTTAEQPTATAADSKVVYVSAPPEPKKKGARGVGTLVVLLGAVIFAAVYAALVLLVSIIAPPVSAGAMLQYFAAPIYWVPVIVFALSYQLLVIIVNRAGWWAHVLGGFIVAVLVYVSFIGAALIMAGAVGAEASVVGSIVLAQLTSPLGFAAAIAAREVPIWVGGLVAKRGRTVTARNAEARAAYQRDLEAHRASVGGQTAV